MAQSDYILRLIEQLGSMLAELRRRVFGDRLGGEALEGEIERTLEQVGLGLDLALSASPDTLLMMVSPTGEVDATRCWVLGECLYLRGIERQMCGDDEASVNAFERARVLFAALAPSAAFYGLEEAAGRIDDIDERRARLSGRGREA